jgi:hypothetical protein
VPDEPLPIDVTETPGQPPEVTVKEFGPGTPILSDLRYRPSSHRMITAARLATGLLIIFGLTVLPPILAGIWKPLCANYLDYVKWAVAVEVAALGAALGFFFSEEKR